MNVSFQAGLTSGEIGLLSMDLDTFTAETRKRIATQVKSEMSELATVSCFEAVLEGSMDILIGAFSAAARKGKTIIAGQGRPKNARRNR